MEKGIVVRGIAYDKNIARISVIGVADVPGMLHKIFQSLADASIDVDIIVQSGVTDGRADFSFSVHQNDEPKARQVLEAIRGDIQFQEVTTERGLVKVSIVGAGMVSHPGVAAKMFGVIAGQGVNIKMVSTSEIKASCVIDSEKLPQVITALHTAYGLDTEEQAEIGGPEVRR